MIIDGSLEHHRHRHARSERAMDVTVVAATRQHRPFAGLRGAATLPQAHRGRRTLGVSWFAGRENNEIDVRLSHATGEWECPFAQPSLTLFLSE